MHRILKAIATRLLVLAGVLVIALALVIGAIRLVIAQLPGYQDELRAWVTAELGVEPQFAALDARLGLYGPELDLRNVRLQVVGTERQFLEADRASLTLDPWALLIQRRVAISRLTLDGARLGIERSVDGIVHVQGLPAVSPTRSALADVLPASVDVVIRNSQFLYIDRIARYSWLFADLNLALERGPESLEIDARARPPAELGERIEIEASQSTIGDSIDATLRLTGLELASVANMLTDGRLRTFSGAGDVDVSAQWRDGLLTSAKATVALAELDLDAGTGGPAYDRLAFGADWTRAGKDGFDLAVSEIDVTRAGRPWPAAGSARLSVADGSGVIAASADFIRLEDLYPLVAQFAPADIAARWTLLSPRGDLDSLGLQMAAGFGDRDFTFEAGFTGLAVEPQQDSPGFVGLDGDVRAGAGAGTINFASSRVTFSWPGYLDSDAGGGGLRGTVVWRRGQDGLRVLSDDLRLDLFGEPLAVNFDFGLPEAGASPNLDLHGHIDRIAVPDAKTLLPRQGLPPSVHRWLQNALQGGTGTDVTVDFSGALDEFPFANGEGRFLVTADVADAAIKFIADWPSAEDLAGQIRFENAGFSATGTGRVLDSLTDDLRAAISDMRAPVLEIDATVGGPLDDVLEFVQTAPLIARHLGPGFDRLYASSGDAVMALDLHLPLLSFGDFALNSRLQIANGGLGIDGFGPEASEINGVLDIQNSNVSGTGIGAVFLGGAVDATVSPAELEGYRTRLDVTGETTSDAVLDAFSLPLRSLVDGQTLWSGRLLLPRAESDDPGPLRIDVESNLSGVALRFPDPLTKAPGEAVNMQLSFVFDRNDVLSIAGNFGATRRFEFSLDRRNDRFALSRGAVAFGGEDPVLPLRDGIVVSGRVPQLRLDDWLAATRNSSIDQARPLFYSARLEIGDFEAFGQKLGTTMLDVQRGDRVWDIDLDSAAIAGRIEVPENLQYRGAVIADMERVYLAAGNEAVGSSGIDPTTLPGLRLRAAEFGFGSRELGTVEADVVAEPMGLRLTSFTSSTANYALEASGSWLADATGSISRIAATVTSSDVAATLNQLGIEPVIAGESGELSASIFWSGPPTSGWLDHLNGDVALSVQTGSLIDVDPGAGRVVGLMSIAALPRRLLLDFRDVFNKGFSFDEITGSFTIEDGNAYTDDLKLSGPAAEIGVIGRTGLRDRDYQQQAVVTAEPSNMLPTVGGLLGGPGVGAALLLFTRIFKKPLRGIGRASYCVTGSWDKPAVERIDSDQPDGAEACVSMPELLAVTSNGG